MIQTLQKRFILAAMLSLALVLAILLSGINLLGYRRAVRDADMILDVLESNQGSFPNHMQWEQPRDERDLLRGIPTFDRRKPSPEAPYESRFFTVTLDDSGAAVSHNLQRISSVDEETAIQCASRASSSQRTRGFWGDFRYRVQYQEGTTTVIFLDCSRSLSIFWTTLVSSILVSVVGLAAVLVLLILVSRRIVRPIADSYEKQRRFITDAGHELRTPLTVINADADLVELECGESEWLEDIRRQTQRLAGLTNDLICLSRMEEERPVLQMVEFPISDVVEETAQSFLALARQQEKELSIHVTPMLSLQGAEKEIRQLVSLLVENAIKYSPAGSTVSLELTRETKMLRLSVTNTSAHSLEKDDLAHMFDRFYRMDASRNSDTGGYGLGLAIARGIVTAHRGKIRAESPDGSTLTITAAFPLTEK